MERNEDSCYDKNIEQRSPDVTVAAAERRWHRWLGIPPGPDGLAACSGWLGGHQAASPQDISAAMSWLGLRDVSLIGTSQLLNHPVSLISV
eukprot:scaffold11172_cov46-Prasinocladus_malaysianus.AAC.2